MLPADRPPLLIVSDVHLNQTGSQAHARELARLVEEHPGAECVLAGDVFDLSRDPPDRDAPRSILDLLRRHEPLFAALRKHLHAGNRVTLIAGNHDAALSDPRVREALIDAFELQPDALLETAPWFVRRGRVHIEHGHLYDPDNAPAHPLALWSHATEPLGVALTRRFLAPTGALQLAHAHETTPLRALGRAVELFGVRAPLIVARYFGTAIRLCAEAGRQRGLSVERSLGESALDEFAKESGLSVDVLLELLSERADPTHLRFSHTFMRLYFDRVLASLSLVLAGSSLLRRPNPLALTLTAMSGAYLGKSVKSQKNRYSGVIEQRLREAAEYVADKTRAELVVFGHTHREDEGPRYLNSGSFAYAHGTGRPYVWIEHGRPPERRRSS